MIYEPQEDSFLLEQQVRKYSKNKSVLDMGSGSGIQAQAAKSTSAKSVIACDIDSDSIKYIKKQGLPCIKSNLFSNIKGKFDLIIFNPPYLPEDKEEDKESRKATTGGKNGDELILRFLEQSKKHLAPNGIILLLISSLTPLNKIIPLLSSLNLKKQVVSSEKHFFEKLEVWKIHSL